MPADEKDRFGDKLRDAERAREDQYFKEHNRKLVEHLRERRGSETNTPEQTANRHCPKCNVRLAQHTHAGVTLDECPSCHGMWLEHGELQKIALREDQGWIARWLRLEFRKPE